jgi:hypothetical protein
MTITHLVLAATILLGALTALYGIGAAVDALRKVSAVLRFVDGLGPVHTSRAQAPTIVPGWEAEGDSPRSRPAASTMGPRAAQRGGLSLPAGDSGKTGARTS